MILLLILIVSLIIGGLTGRFADSRDREFQLWPVAKGHSHRLS